MQQIIDFLIEQSETRDRYMFSESAGLLCRVTHEYKYWVVNGCWNGTMQGEEFIMHTPLGDVQYPEKITDWVEVYPQYWSPEWQHMWYYKRDRRT